MPLNAIILLYKKPTVRSRLAPLCTYKKTPKTNTSITKRHKNDSLQIRPIKQWMFCENSKNPKNLFRKRLTLIEVLLGVRPWISRETSRPLKLDAASKRKRRKSGNGKRGLVSGSLCLMKSTR